MAEKIETAKWRVIGESRRGASHVRLGLRNQDAIEYWVSESQDTLVLAVADGHGSSTFFRSDTGSRMAVETAVRILRSFAKREDPSASPVSILAAAKRDLPNEITGSWRQTVEAHLRAHPIRDEEWIHVADSEEQTIQARVAADPVVVYGSTLLAVLITPRFILYLQLGDGDILKVDASGETQRAVDRDETLSGNQTHSLCQPQAPHEVRINVQDVLENPPAMILAATDGYSNSFVSDSDFFLIGRDYLKMVQTEGLDKAEKELARFLDETSAEGSGDDVTLGVVSRVGASSIVPPRMRAIPDAEIFDEEEIPMAVAAKLTADLEDARRRINQLDLLVSSLTARVRSLQIGITVALIVAGVSLALAVYRPAFTRTDGPAAATSPGAVPPKDAKKEEAAPLRLLIGPTEIVLEAGMTLTSEQLGLGSDAKKSAQVRRANRGSSLELVNLSPQAWTVTTSAGQIKTIKTGEAIELKAGMDIRFGSSRAKIA